MRSIIRGLIASLLLTIHINSIASSPLSDERYREYKLKAALTLNIARFTSWPNVPSNKSVSLCVVLDPNNTRSAIQQDFMLLENQNVGSRSLAIQMISDPSEIEDCNIVYVTGKDHRQLETVTQSIHHKPVLIISEVDEFIDTKGMANLIQEQDRLVIQVNQDNVNHAGLKMSARLLKLVRLVQGGR